MKVWAPRLAERRIVHKRRPAAAAASSTNQEGKCCYALLSALLCAASCCEWYRRPHLLTEQQSRDAMVSLPMIYIGEARQVLKYEVTYHLWNLARSKDERASIRQTSLHSNNGCFAHWLVGQRGSYTTWKCQQVERRKVPAHRQPMSSSMLRNGSLFVIAAGAAFLLYKLITNSPNRKKNGNYKVVCFLCWNAYECVQYIIVMFFLNWINLPLLICLSFKPCR